MIFRDRGNQPARYWEMGETEGNHAYILGGCKEKWGTTGAGGDR